MHEKAEEKTSENLGEKTAGKGEMRKWRIKLIMAE